jgi:hypothetical protein
VAQQRHREKTKKPSNPMKKMSKVGTPLKGEVRAVKDFADGKVDKNFQPIVPEGT